MEKELLKIFEETTNRNIKMILDHSNETRKMVKHINTKVRKTEAQFIIQNKIIDDLRNQLSTIQSKIYVGGS